MSKQSWLRWWRACGYLGVVLVWGVSLLTGCSLFGDGPSSPIPTVTVAPPDGGDGGIDFALPDLAGNTVTARDFRGKPLVLVFFKTYCPHCQNEEVFLKKVYQSYRNQVQFLGIAVNEQGTSGRLIAPTSVYAQEVTRSFVNQYGWTFPVLIDDYGRVQRELAGTVVPSIVLVDAEGMIEHVVKDTLSQGALKSLIQLYLL